MRDFIGYGKQKPIFSWPKNARIAVNFVINYEAGAENCILNGAEKSEDYLTDIPYTRSKIGKRNTSVESMFEYGSRCGIWRLHDLFDKNNIPVTIFCCGLALEKNLSYAEYLKNSQHEVAGHGYLWTDYSNIPISVEKEHIEKTIKIIKDLTGKTIHGWYTGRKSSNTVKLLAPYQFDYLSDSYNDDLPYLTKIDTQDQLIVPYTLLTNDFRYTTSPGFSTAEEFYSEVKNAFDFQYYESLASPQLLTIALHERLSGRPSRAMAINNIIKYIKSKPNVWITSRKEIAQHYFKNIQATKDDTI